MQNNQGSVLVGYLPSVLAEVHELEKICNLEQPLFDEAWQAVDNVLSEQFATTCGEYGLARWENLLKITPSEGSDTEERLRAVLFRLNEQLPFTIRKLEMLLGLVSPAGGCNVEMDYDERRLDVWLSLYCRPMERLIREVLERALPANILCVVHWNYNTHAMAAVYTHAELADMTHYAIREEVFE